MKVIVISVIFAASFFGCSQEDEQTVFDVSGRGVWVDCTDGRGRTIQAGQVDAQGIDLYSTFVNPSGDSKGYAVVVYPESGSYGYKLVKSGGGIFDVYAEDMQVELFPLEQNEVVWDRDVEAGTVRIVRCKRGSRIDSFEIRIRKEPS